MIDPDEGDRGEKNKMNAPELREQADAARSKLALAALAWATVWGQTRTDPFPSVGDAFLDLETAARKWVDADRTALRAEVAEAEASAEILRAASNEDGKPMSPPEDLK